jgi:hypothetical protein
MLKREKPLRQRKKKKGLMEALQQGGLPPELAAMLSQVCAIDAAGDDEARAAEYAQLESMLENATQGTTAAEPRKNNADDFDMQQRGDWLSVLPGGAGDPLTAAAHDIIRGWIDGEAVVAVTSSESPAEVCVPSHNRK